MATTGARTLQLLSLLQHHRFWTGAELAARLEVSPRTLRRDVDRLRGLGYPISATRGVDGGYRLEAGARLAPLLLDDDEAVALVVGLHGAAHGDAAAVAEASVRALGKVMQLLPVHLRADAEALHTMTVRAGPTTSSAVAAATLSTLALACRDATRVRFAYTDRAGAGTDRLVEPYRLVSLGRRWYLVAYDMDRLDWRTFRVDRLQHPVAARNSFTPRPLPAADLATYVRERVDRASAVHDVDVVVHAPVDAVRRAVGPWGTVEVLAADHTRLRMQVDSLDWVLVVLGAVDADFEVRAPDALVAHVRERAARLGRAGISSSGAA